MWMNLGWLIVDDLFCGDVKFIFLLPVAGVNGFLSDMVWEMSIWAFFLCEQSETKYLALSIVLYWKRILEK